MTKMKKDKGLNDVLLGLAIALIVVLSVVGLIFIQDFVGWYYHAARAGTITAFTIHHTYTADAWHGFAGTAILDYDNNETAWSATVGGGNTTIMDFDFNCFGKSGFDIYISTVPREQLDIATIQPATVADIDAFIGIDPAERISATSTFTQTFTVNLGGVYFTGPGFRTNCACSNNTFHQVALKDGDGDLFFAANATRAMPGFDGEIHNYQMMVPVPYNQSTITYYLFPDPVTDIPGECSSWSYAPLRGYVTDSATSLPLANVTVHVGDAIGITNSTGWYDVLAQVDTNFFLGFKQGYFDYVSLVTVVQNVTNYHNFSMNPTLNQSSEFRYGFVSGIITDQLGNPLENVTVMTGIFNNITGPDGNYSLISLEGNNTMIVAMKTGYRTNITYVDVAAYQMTLQNMTLVELPALFGPNGTVYGKVYDWGTTDPIDNATIYVGSWSTRSNSTGDYSLNMPSYSFYYIVATADFYDAVVGELSGNQTLRPNSNISYNIYMNQSNLLTGLYDQPPGDAGMYTEPPVEQPEQDLTQITQPGAENGTGLIVHDEAGKIAAYLSIRQIRNHIKQDAFFEQTLAFYNFRDQNLNIELEVEGDVTSILELSDNQISIEPDTYGEVNIIMMGSEDPGLYQGNLLIKGDLEATLPVEIRISKEGKIPIKTLMMTLDVLKKIVVQGTPVKYKLDLVNLLTDRKYQVDLKFYVASINGTRLTNVTERTIVLETFTSLVGQIQIPDDFEPEDYVIRAQADYLGLTSTTDALFSVREPFYAYDLLGIIPVWLLATLLALLATAVFIGQEIKRRQDAKKRFHAKIEYDELPQEGERSLFVGNIAETNKKSYFDMDRLTVHSIVATGGGKSISAQDIIEEALIKGTAVAVFDPTAQWSGMLRKLEDKKFLEFYAKFGMDPKKDPRGFNGNIKAVKNGREIIDIFKYLRPGEIQIFTTNTLDPKDYDIFVASMIQQIFHSKLDEFRGLKYMLVFDEIHRILPKFGGSGAGFTQIERGCREFRKWGIGIVLISQVLSDFVGEIKANINTLVQMKTRDEGDLERIKMQYGEEYIQSLIKSPVGSGMVQNSSWNRGKPYYVTFRPILHSVVRLTDEELDKYNHYNEIVEQLEFEFDQLEELKQDVFDLRLELKLSKDKIKSGNFNMVQIYLDGLTPRVQKMWEKLGKQPQKLQIKLLDTAEIDAAVKKEKAEKKTGGDKDGAGKSDGGDAGGGGEDKPDVAHAPSQKSSPAETKPAPAPAAQAAQPAQAPPAKQGAPAMNASVNAVAQFTNLIRQANQAISSRNRPGAVQLYRQMTAVYKSIPQPQKPMAYKHIQNINRQVSLLK
jgi:hypothetical protein